LETNTRPQQGDLVQTTIRHARPHGVRTLLSGFWTVYPCRRARSTLPLGREIPPMKRESAWCA